MYDEFEEKLNTVLRTGRLPSSKGEEIEDLEIDLTINILRQTAQEHADHLLQKIATVASIEMTTLTTAVLLANAPEKYLAHHQKKATLRWLLAQMVPRQLLEIVEYLKSGILGRGFGSRPQKMIRGGMESWSEDTIERFILSDKAAMKRLVHLVHPRYQNKRGELIRILMSG